MRLRLIEQEKTSRLRLIEQKKTSRWIDQKNPVRGRGIEKERTLSLRLIDEEKTSRLIEREKTLRLKSTKRLSGQSNNKQRTMVLIEYRKALWFTEQGKIF